MPRRFALTKSPGRKGQCTLTITGCTVAVTALWNWRIYNEDLVILSPPVAGHTGTSNSTSLSFTGLSPEISPGVGGAHGRDFAFDNAVVVAGGWFISSGLTVLNLFVDIVSGTKLIPGSTNFVNAGLKGVGGDFFVAYRLRLEG